MKKFFIQAVALVIIVIGATYFAFNQSASLNLFNFSTNKPLSSQTKLKVGTNLVNIEIADTNDKRSKGLGGRDSLPADSGMLFIFDHSDRYKFWMKDMKIPLDFIWINSGSVVDILPNVPFPSSSADVSSLPIYEPVAAVDQVLEVNAGFAASHGIKIGDKVELVK